MHIKNVRCEKCGSNDIKHQVIYDWLGLDKIDFVCNECGYCWEDFEAHYEGLP